MSRYTVVLSLALLQILTVGAGVTSATRATPAHVVGPPPVAVPTVVEATRPAHPPVRRHPPHRQLGRTEPAASPYLLLALAVTRLPDYRPDEVHWSVVPGLPHWGVTDLGAGSVQLSASIPADRFFDVVAHEWSHVRTVRDYDGDVQAALADTNRVFGGRGVTGAERAADCMALLLGARWTHYTGCVDPRWRAAARRLLAGKRV